MVHKPTTASLVVAGVPIIQDEAGRYNLNVLHKASDFAADHAKAPHQWLRRKSARDLISALQTQAVNLPLETVHGGERAGTYAHELLAVEYAGWISTAFRLKVNQAFIDSRTGGRTVPQVSNPQTAALIQALLEADQARQLAQAASDTAQEVKQDTAQVKQDLGALKSHRPPEGKLTPWGYLAQYSKPWLPDEVKDLFKTRCRALEAPELFQPQGAAHPWPYYTLQTLETAYAQATRQLSFLTEPLGWSRRRSQR